MRREGLVHWGFGNLFRILGTEGATAKIRQITLNLDGKPFGGPPNGATSSDKSRVSEMVALRASAFCILPVGVDSGPAWIR